jgi:L-asparaginase II
MDSNVNPILVEAYRGNVVESRHRGAFAVIGPGGSLTSWAGDIDTPIYPRSAIKAFQALPLVENGAADKLGLSDAELALVCSSHNGEEAHVERARSILAKAGLGEDKLECGAHSPQDAAALRMLIKSGVAPAAIHNNCSGKHAGMLALAAMLGEQTAAYVGSAHPVQRRIARLLDELCSVDTGLLPVALDGCSVPTWAIPLRNLALGFQRLVSGETLGEAVPRAFVKTGAEGVFCGAVPHAGLGIALKCDDGANRASEAAMAALLAGLGVWTADERERLAGFAEVPLRNWRKFEVGRIRSVLPAA